MLRSVTFVRTDVSEETRPSIRVTKIGEVGKTIAVPSNRTVPQLNIPMRMILLPFVKVKAGIRFAILKYKIKFCHTQHFLVRACIFSGIIVWKYLLMDILHNSESWYNN
jgi:hypothetical protein